MNTRTNIVSLGDFFKEKPQRDMNTSYAATISAYNGDVHEFLLSYYGVAIRCGAVVEDKMANPTNEQIAYMNETIGSDFEVSSNFISAKLQRWIQTINADQAKSLSESMYSVLMDLRNLGKNDSALKNAYTKFMCWLYYRFRSVLSQLCKNDVPKVIYEGMITNYELYMLEILIRCGCDVLILDYGTQDKVKAETMFPQTFDVQNGSNYPEGFSIKTLKFETIMRQKMDNMCGPKSVYKSYKNAWLTNIKMEEVVTSNRSSDPNLICNAFLKFTGVDDRNTYVNQLYKIYDNLQNTGAKITIVENGIQPPSAGEISALKRTNCSSIMDVMAFISSNLQFTDVELTKYAKHVFRDYLMALNASESILRKVEEQVTKTLALFNRYTSLLSVKSPGHLFILETSPLSENDYRFLELLSEFPIDIVVFNPAKLEDADSSILEATYDNILSLDKFPTERTEASYSTTAFNAENDLTSMIYQDSGMYRNRQYQKAEPIILKTMYEEIDILWKENVSMRPGFSTDDDKVVIPTIFAKICGVKDGNKKLYVKSIEKLIMDNENVIYIKDHFPFPLTSSGQAQPQNNGFGSGFSSGLGYAMGSMLGGALSGGRQQTPTQAPINLASVMSNGKIDDDRIKNHELFKFSHLRDETVNFMIDRFKYMVDSKTIDGIGTHGAENTLLEMFFNLPKEIVTLIQRFDFTKINPKIVYTNSGESIITLEETMLLQYLSFLGFDIVMFIPTGYNTIEKYFKKKLFTEYQIGDYMYDLNLDVKKKKGFFK